MKKNYDFSNADLGKFYKENSQINLPIYLESKIQNYSMERANSKGITVSQLVNELLKQSIDLIETVK